MSKQFLIATLYFTAAFLTLGAAFVAESQFPGPIIITPGGPRVIPTPPDDYHPVPLHAGRDYQEKAGDLGAYTFWLGDNGGREAHVPQPIRVKHYQAVSQFEPAYAFCDPGYRLLSCSGGRELFFINLCGEEICAYVGTIPIDRYGFESIQISGDHEAIGCRTDIKGSTGEEARATVFAFCMRDEF